ncbi:MAG TPA: hypothetical protein VH054_17505 [Polyangiaceae bacterium]|jgi:hypothetical protein|nr:hypothetical protein [Polyangiaceae bacterium]
MRSVISLLALGVLGCTSAAPPSQLPSAQAAIDRVRATGACGNAVRADAKLDHFAQDSGRIRTELLFIAARPARMRMDALAPVVGTVLTLTTDGEKFQVADLRNHQFLYGPATPENIARVSHLPMPLHPFISLLQGRAPILKHDAEGLAAPTIAWDGAGFYVVRIPGNSDAVEEIHMAPSPDDWKKPWAEQRMRVLDVQVTQRGVLLYHVELDSHEKASMAPPAACDDVCKATGETPAPPSGPMCEAELPRRIHVEVPPFSADELFRYEKVVWNPPIDSSTFTQPQPQGLTPRPLE